MKIAELKVVRRERRIARVRKKLYGTAERPRLSVTRSNRNIYVQVIDDTVGRTLCSASTRAKGFDAGSRSGGTKAAAAAVGKAIGEKAKAVGITAVCFDRRGYRYHGRIKALADAAREAGLKF